MKENLTNKVVDFRKEHDLTQVELADIVNVTRQTIIAIEKGNYVPSVALAIKIAEAFDTEVEKLFLLDK